MFNFNNSQTWIGNETATCLGMKRPPMGQTGWGMNWLWNEMTVNSQSRLEQLYIRIPTINGLLLQI